MLIYTSYFANRKVDTREIQSIAICLYPPKWFKGLCYPRLAPRADIFKKYQDTGDWKAFSDDYRECCLSILDPEEIVSEIISMSPEKPPSLTCFEKYRCHRHLAADWLASNVPDVEVLEI